MLKGSPARKTVAALSQKKRPPQPNCQFQEKPWSCLGKTFFPQKAFIYFIFFKLGSRDNAIHLYHSIPNLGSRIKVLPSLTYISGFSCSSCIREKSGVSREMCLAGYWTLAEDGNIDKYRHTHGLEIIFLHSTLSVRIFSYNSQPTSPSPGPFTPLKNSLGSSKRVCDFLSKEKENNPIK